VLAQSLTKTATFETNVPLPGRAPYRGYLLDNVQIRGDFCDDPDAERFGSLSTYPASSTPMLKKYDSKLARYLSTPFPHFPSHIRAAQHFFTFIFRLGV
jgi:hypothetical protein